MAHASETRTQLRGLYVYQRMAMEAACKKLGVPRSTANRWKQDAEDKGDNWDSARAAIAMGDQNFSVLAKQILEDYLLQHQSTMTMLREDKALTALQKAETLASMADSLNKTMAAFKRVSPELNRQSVQMDTITRMAAFVQKHYPQHLSAVSDFLEAFGASLFQGD